MPQVSPTFAAAKPLTVGPSCRAARMAVLYALHVRLLVLLTVSAVCWAAATCPVQCQGKQGPAGKGGPAGKIGPVGPQGKQGPPGPQGRQGVCAPAIPGNKPSGNCFQQAPRGCFNATYKETSLCLGATIAHVQICCPAGTIKAGYCSSNLPSATALVATAQHGNCFNCTYVKTLNTLCPSVFAIANCC